MKLHLPLALSVALLAFASVLRSQAVGTSIWTGGSGTWSDSSAAEWDPATDVPAGRDVVFTADGQGTVSLDGSVTPATVAVQGGTYVFQQAAGTSGGIVTAGSFTVSGDDTQVSLASANTGLSGEVVLEGGTLQLGAEDAIGSATLFFNGGTLVYESGISQDLSAQVATASTSPVRVDTGSNAVTWGNRSTSDIPAYVAALTNGVVKSGSGTLTLVAIQGSSGTYAGDISVQGGRLNIYADYANGSAGSSAPMTLNGSITVSAGAWLSLGTTFDSSNSIRMTLAGNLSGSGTVEIGNPENYHAGAESKAGGGRYAVTGDNSAFEGTLRLSGLADSATLLYNGVQFATDAALGGSLSTLQLNGRQFWILETQSVHTLPMAVELVEGSNSVFHPNNNQTYNFSATLSGSGTLTGLDNRSSTVQFSGNIAACTGSLISGSSNVFLLGGADVVSPGGAIAMTLGGSGAFVFQYTSAVTLAGTVQGSASLQQSGAGVLTLTGDNSSTGTLTIDDTCTVSIGTSATAGMWAGSVTSGTGRLVLVNGGLSADLGVPTVELVVNAAAGATVSAGGTSGSFISRITLPAGSRLTGVSGNLTTGETGLQALHLTLTEANVGSGSAATAKIDQGSGTLTVSAGTTVDISLSPNALVETLVEHNHDGIDSYLTLTSGTLNVENLADIALSPLLENYGLRVVRTEGGSLVVSGQTQGLYYVTSDPDTTDPHSVEDYPTLGLYAGVILQSGQTLSVALPGAPENVMSAAYVNNLMGADGSVLVVENSGSGTAVLVLNNSLLQTLLDDPATVGADTAMAGAMRAGANVLLVKSGSGTLEISGGFRAEMLRLDNGTLYLSGTADNSLAELSDASHGGALRLAKETTLHLTGDSALSLSVIEGPGTLDLRGSLALSGTAVLKDVVLALPQSGALNVGETTGNRLAELSGEGRITGSGGELQLTGKGVFRGSLSGSGNNVLTVAAGASLSLDHVRSEQAWSVTNQGRLSIDVSGASANQSLRLGALSLTSKSATTLVINTDVNTASALQLNSLSIDSGASVTLKSTGELAIELDENGQRAIGHVYGQARSRSALATTPLELEGVSAFKHIAAAWLSVENNLLLFNAQVVTYNRYAAVADSPNALAGANLMWDLPNSVLAANPGLRALDEALFERVDGGRRTEANTLMVALSGAAATVQGAAFAGDMERQLRAMRNRSVALGLAPCQDYPDLPHVHMWAQAEGNFYRRDAEGTDSGYSFDNWGGTLGVDMDITPTFGIGAAFTAMFGELSARGQGSLAAEGDLDSYYASLMARYACHAWVQSLVVSFGWAESTFHRNVFYEGGGYRSKGSTDGFGFGLLYELAYSIFLGEESQYELQPVANVSFAHTRLSGYSEHGSEAALRFGDQQQNIWEFGLGVRFQAPVAETLANRTVWSEWRALVKFAAGDRCSATQSSLVAAPGNIVSIRSAERESVGVELGAGITIPLDIEAGVLFLDAAALLWSDIYNFNAVIGYRREF